MIHFLHTFNPSRILIAFGPINIYWYGIFIVLGILLAIIAAIKLAGYYGVSKDMIIDLAFWLILAGLIGARVYFIFMEWEYYLAHPLDIIKFWQGGLAIHGALIAGLLAIWFYAKKHKINFWLLSALLAPGVALAQAFGRWGNYFNQELFGRPTDLPWGIPILPANRVLEYYNFQYFHPVFLYESIGCLLIAGLLIGAHVYQIKKQRPDGRYILIAYLSLYSILRFSVEFLRVDPVPVFGPFRIAQVASLIVILASLIFIGIILYNKYKRPLALEKI